MRQMGSTSSWGSTQTLQTRSPRPLITLKAVGESSYNQWRQRAVFILGIFFGGGLTETFF